MKRFVLILATIFITLEATAQTPIYEIGFRYRFDNREYGNAMDENSETIFAARLGLTGGLAFGEGHAIMAGVGLPLDFGQRTFYNTPAFIAYYRYETENEHTRLFAGVFPRVKMRGNYSNAFFSDATRFLDSNLEGLLYQTQGEWGSVEAGADWNGMYSDDRRESFRLFSAGEFNILKYFSLGYNGTMFHYAGSTTIHGVVDNHLFMPYAKFELDGDFGISARAGYLVGYQWDRVAQTAPTYPMGFEGELALWWKRWNFNTTIYIGDDLMPLYTALDATGNSYGTSLYCGEQFYRATNGIYSRISLGYQIIKNRYLTASAQSVFHLDGKHFGWQQVVAITIFLNNGQNKK